MRQYEKSEGDRARGEVSAMGPASSGSRSLWGIQSTISRYSTNAATSAECGDSNSTGAADTGRSWE